MEMKSSWMRWERYVLAALVVLMAPNLSAESSDKANDAALYAAPAKSNSAPKSDLPPSVTGTETQESAELFVPKEKVFIKINLPATRLDFYVDGTLRKSYQVAIGMPKYPTPIRDYNITYINWNPWWIPPESDWAANAQKTPPGPGNPLGPVKMMMEDGIRIHGTNAPGSVGRAASHACMRMKNAEAQELAWEIQQRYSDKTDPALLETYQKQRRTPYWITLGQVVPVYVEYRLVERDGDKFLIHPDRYWRGGLQKELEEALAAHPDIVVDKEFIKKLTKLRVKGGTLEMTLQDLRDVNAPAVAPLPPSAAPVPSSATAPAAPNKI